jgi:hypothetical protein
MRNRAEEGVVVVEPCGKATMTVVVKKETLSLSTRRWKMAIWIANPPRNRTIQIHPPIDYNSYCKRRGYRFLFRG